MSFQTGSIDADGLARTSDGKLYVTIAGSASSTSPAGAPGFTTALAQSFTAVSGAADTNENTLGSISLPANTLGTAGGVRIRGQFSFTSSANSKTMRIKFGATTYLTSAQTTATPSHFDVTVGNRGATNSQVGTSLIYVSGGVFAISSATSAVDTTGAVTIAITGQKATAGETLTLDWYTVEVIRAS